MSGAILSLPVKYIQTDIPTVNTVFNHSLTLDDL